MHPDKPHRQIASAGTKLLKRPGPYALAWQAKNMPGDKDVKTVKQNILDLDSCPSTCGLSVVLEKINLTLPL